MILEMKVNLFYSIYDVVLCNNDITGEDAIAVVNVAEAEEVEPKKEEEEEEEIDPLDAFMLEVQHVCF
jgi:hypothetical protein